MLWTRFTASRLLLRDFFKRIVAGLAQLDLAEGLELKEQQVQRHEAVGYASANYQRLYEVARALRIWSTPEPSFG